MMHETTTTMDTTRRCLFPTESMDSVDSDLESNSCNFPRMFGLPALTTATGQSTYHDDDQSQHHRKSPTGVLDHPGLPPLAKESLQSTITMSEDGAEVTLSLANLNLVTPEKANPVAVLVKTQLGQVRTTSLMDVDCTPTRPPAGRKSVAKEFVDAWCGNSSAQCVSEDEYLVSNNHKLEQQIATFLEDESTPVQAGGYGSCSDWQFWSFSLATNSMEAEDVSIQEIRSNLRKRVVNMRARQTRVRQYRRDMSPFGKSPSRDAPQLYRSRSFSVSDSASAIIRQSKEQQSSSFSNVLQLCTLPENAVSESPMLLRYNKSVDGEDVCYDSDPEDFARGRSPRRSPNKENSIRCNYPATIHMEDAIDEFAYRNLVQEFLNHTSTLVYHPTTTMDSGAVEASSPVAVDAWLERGQRLHEIIQPKWMWRLKPRCKKSGPIVQMMAVHGIELLEITRILKVAKVNRKLYPFAKPFKCLLLRTMEGEEFCFEAKSMEDRNRIAYSLKLVIARFGAMVLAADEHVYDEFFVTDAPIPEGLPQVLDLQEDDSDSDSSEEDSNSDSSEEDGC